MARRSRADRGSAVAKVRVYELAKEFGVESKAVMAKLQEMGEFVRSASSTIEAPVVRRLKEAFAGQAGKANGNGSAPKAPAPARRPAEKAEAPAEPAAETPAAAIEQAPAPAAPVAERPAAAVTVPFPADRSKGPQVPPAETMPVRPAGEP